MTASNRNSIIINNPTIHQDKCRKYLIFLRVHNRINAEKNELMIPTTTIKIKKILEIVNIYYLTNSRETLEKL